MGYWNGAKQPVGGTKGSMDGGCLRRSQCHPVYRHLGILQGLHSIWATSDWMVAKQLLWDKDVWAVAQLKTVIVFHVPAHAGLTTPHGNHEAESLTLLHWAQLTLQEETAQWPHSTTLMR